MKTPIKFTIVTSTFNAGTSLADTARSLQNQTYRHIEWIIIDGASTDDTVELARSFGNLVTALVSEPDSGIYSAWNKALPLITGDWVLFLGAGDELYQERTLADVATCLSSVASDVSIAYGNVIVVDEETRTDLRLRNDSWMGLEGPWITGRPALPCHQGVLHRISLFTDGFKFDIKCKIAADGEIMLREFLKGHGEKLQLTVTRFLWGGISSRRTNRLRMIAEIVYINMKVGVFYRRPFYQIAVLGSNVVKHFFRSLGFDRI